MSILELGRIERRLTIDVDFDRLRSAWNSDVDGVINSGDRGIYFPIAFLEKGLQLDLNISLDGLPGCTIVTSDQDSLAVQSLIVRLE